MTKHSESLLKRNEVANILNVSLRTVDELVSTGDIPVVRLGRSVRVRPSSIEYLIEARESRVNPIKKGGSAV
jgi:excisionase family DNA binding protein